MDAITNAISKLKFKIPRDILTKAFMPQTYNPVSGQYSYTTSTVSLDESIFKQVILPRVVVDLNLCSGTDEWIDLTKLTPEFYNQYTRIYRIPPDMLDGRFISSVYSVSYTAGYSDVGGMYNSAYPSSLVYGNQGDINRLSNDLFRSVTTPTRTGTANVRLVGDIGDNAVEVVDYNVANGQYYLNCRLSNPPNFNNIKPDYYQLFTEIVTLAVKSYIYNKLIIEIDDNQLRYGMAIGKFKEIVDQYADAETMYEDIISTKWRMASIMNDQDKYQKIIRAAVGYCQ